MIVVLFRNRLQPGAEEAYAETARSVIPAAVAVPGYVSHKVFTAEDGERVTIVEYASEGAMREWARDPRHLAAKMLGRQDFYADYKVQICSLLRERRFKREATETHM